MRRFWLSFSDWPLRVKLAVLLATVSVLPLALAAFLELRDSHARLMSGTGELLQARADQLVQALDEFHFGHLQAAQRITHFPDVRSYCLAQRSAAPLTDAHKGAAVQEDEVRGILRAYPATNTAVRGAALLSDGGRVMVATEAAMVSADLAFQSHVGRALQGTSVISDVFLGLPPSRRTPSIAYLVPVVDSQGHVACVAAIWVRADALWQKVKASNALAGRGSYAVLFDNLGIRIAHSYSDGIVFQPGGKLDSRTVDRLVAENRFGDRTRELLSKVSPPLEQFERARSAKPDLSVFRSFSPVNRAWNLGVARRFQSVPWTVFFMVPETNVLDPLSQDTLARILLTGAIAAAAVMIGLLLASNILQPIETLTKAIRALATGELTARSRACRDDEIGQLGKSFDAMAERFAAQDADLRQSRDELEYRVQDRTTSLRQITQELEGEIAERKLIQADMDKNQRLLQGIIDNTSAVIYVKDLEGRYVLVNRKFTELFSHIDRFVGTTDHELFEPTIAAAFRSVDLQVMSANEPMVEEESVPVAGRTCTFVSVKCPLCDARGLVEGVFGISTDITERKQAEDVLRANEERIRLILDTALDAVVSIDDAGCITEWNPQAEATFGWQRAEVLGRSLVLTIVPPQFREAHQNGMRRYLASGQSSVLNKRIELTALHRNGREFPIDIAITPLRTNGTTSFSAFVRNITDRKNAEARLLAQVDRLNLLDQITCAIGERQDLQSIYQVAVESLEEELPVDFSCVCSHDVASGTLTLMRMGVRSHGLAMTLAMDEASSIAIDQNGLSRCIRGELVYEPDIAESRFPFPQRLSRGGLRSLVVAPLQSESGVFGILIAARREANGFSSGECEFLRQLSAHIALAAQHAELIDALQRAYDDLRLTQQAVMQQERLSALGQMASGIAHDINNAISPVALYTESLLERERQISDRGRHQLQIIARAVDDVGATVARMREFYRQREPQLTQTPVDLNALVAQVVELTRARWSDMPQQRGVVIRLEQDLQADLPAIHGVESEVREALINLIFNAVDAMPHGGALTLRTTDHSSSDPSSADAGMAFPVRIEVTDTGIGMGEETSRRCLEPFFTTKGERGTGLGLAMVYGVVQRHAAKMHIDSAIGRGTTVALCFPLPTRSMATAPMETMSGQVRRLRILIVDDDPVLLKSLCDTLESDGHLVVIANGGQAGIDAFKSAIGTPGRGIDVVVTDLGMPYVDGRKVAAQIKDLAPHTPVVMLTGWGHRLGGSDELPPHVDHMLGKPVTLRELRDVLRHCAPAGYGMGPLDHEGATT